MVICLLDWFDYLGGITNGYFLLNIPRLLAFPFIEFPSSSLSRFKSIEIPISENIMNQTYEILWNIDIKHMRISSIIETPIILILKPQYHEGTLGYDHSLVHTLKPMKSQYHLGDVQIFCPWGRPDRGLQCFGVRAIRTGGFRQALKRKTERWGENSRPYERLGEYDVQCQYGGYISEHMSWKQKCFTLQKQSWNICIRVQRKSYPCEKRSLFRFSFWSDEFWSFPWKTTGRPPTGRQGSPQSRSGLRSLTQRSPGMWNWLGYL